MGSANLSSAERCRLLTALKQARDSRQYRRVLAVLEYSRGKSVTEIAELLRVSRQSVYNWIEHFDQARHAHQFAGALGLVVHPIGARTTKCYSNFC
jgi:predicted DNA-binding protein YlxM (UPF0122 family)